MQDVQVFTQHLHDMAQGYDRDAQPFSVMQMHSTQDSAHASFPAHAEQHAHLMAAELGEDVTGSSSTSKHQSRAVSPSRSSVSSLSSVTATPPPPNMDGTSDVQPPPAKRRKLTVGEKEANRQEKEKAKAEKDRLQAEKKAKREEDRARKDEERAVKDEERRKKNEEREEKRRERDIEKQQKEEIKRQKEEDIAKKERVGLSFLRGGLTCSDDTKAQQRIQSFFTKPVASAASVPNLPATSTGSPQRFQSTSRMDSSNGDSEDISQSITKAKASDYDRTFLPFAASASTKVAPVIRYSLDAGAEKYLMRQADRWLSSDYKHVHIPLIETLDLPPADFTQVPLPMTSVKDIMDSLSGTSVNPIDLASDDNSSKTPLELLQAVPIKYIHFREDVRPPYIGTFTSIGSASELARLARNPVKQQRTELDYDDDSEAEWEEPEEGEDINSEGESEGESVADSDEMDGFLDDEGAEDGLRTKKKQTSTEMEPLSTGICWEDSNGSCSLDAGSGSLVNLQDCRLEFITGKRKF